MFFDFLDSTNFKYFFKFLILGREI